MSGPICVLVGQVSGYVYSLSGGIRSLWGHPERLRWWGYNPVTWPVPSQPGVGHFTSFLSEYKTTVGYFGAALGINWYFTCTLNWTEEHWLKFKSEQTPVTSACDEWEKLFRLLKHLLTKSEVGKPGQTDKKLTTWTRHLCTKERTREIT